jgi:hypothetical protein
MQTETLAIVRPPTTGDQDLASRLSKGFRDASRRVAVYSSPEISALASEDLSNITLVVVSPGQCIETSGNDGAFLSKVASARKRILASVGPVHSPGYLARLRRGIHFDALFDLGFASQKASHFGVSDVPYHFVFNGLTRDEEPLAQEPANHTERTIPWVLVGPRSDKNRDLLGALIEHQIDPGGFCLLQGRPKNSKNSTPPEPMLSGPQLFAVLSKARFYVWGPGRDGLYYESFRFIIPLLAGTVPCKIDPTLSVAGLDIPGVYASVSAFDTEVRDIGYRGMYRRARDFYVSRGRLEEHLSGALRLV